jgi:hypothetical protein
MNQCEDYDQMRFFETWNLKSIFVLIKIENKTLFNAYIIIIVGINVLEHQPYGLFKQKFNVHITSNIFKYHGY